MLRKGSKELSEKGSFGCHGGKTHDKENENKDDTKDTHATKARYKGDVKTTCATLVRREGRE